MHGICSRSRSATEESTEFPIGKASILRDFSSSKFLKVSFIGIDLSFFFENKCIEYFFTFPLSNEIPWFLLLIHLAQIERLFSRVVSQIGINPLQTKKLTESPWSKCFCAMSN